MESETIPKFKNCKPQILKKGDVFLGMGVNYKVRPMVVAIVKETTSYCIALTTTKDSNALINHTSRFFDAGYLCESFILVSNDFIINKFIGVLDDNRNLNKAIELIKDKLISDLKL